MARFWTEAEINLTVDGIYENLSDREILKLVDLFVEEGLVISTTSSKDENMNFMDMEWKQTLMKLMDNRFRLTTEQEEIIKQIANKL
jgi:hypothetical protein